MVVLAFEIGGTTIRGALMDPRSLQLLCEARRPTPNFHDPSLGGADAILTALTDDLAELRSELDPTKAATAVGIGYPGPVSPAGQALASPTLLGPEHDRAFDVVALARRASGIPRALAMNDVTACGFRYVAEGTRDFCLINVGSGIGNKLFLDGKPVIGPMGRGGELGHFSMLTDDDAPLCECGGRGHLAGISSGRGTLAWAEKRRRQDPDGFARSVLSMIPPDARLDNRDIVAAFRAGDPWTTARIIETARPLAHAIAGLHVAVGIERFILVGGFAEALGDTYVDMLISLCRPACWDVGQGWDEMIVAGETGDRDGLMGLAHAMGLAFPDQ